MCGASKAHTVGFFINARVRFILPYRMVGPSVRGMVARRCPLRAAASQPSEPQSNEAKYHPKPPERTRVSEHQRCQFGAVPRVIFSTGGAGPALSAFESALSSAPQVRALEPIRGGRYSQHCKCVANLSTWAGVDQFCRPIFCSVPSAILLSRRLFETRLRRSRQCYARQKSKAAPRSG